LFVPYPNVCHWSIFPTPLLCQALAKRQPKLLLTAESNKQLVSEEGRYAQLLVFEVHSLTAQQERHACTIKLVLSF
jgi:hypothetical protein